MTGIKICGLVSEKDARLVNELDIDYAGVVMFFPESRRNTSAETAKKITAAIRDGIKSVAVVVSPTAEQIRIIESCGFDIIQIHGSADEEIYKTVSLPVFKAFNVKDIDTISSYREYDKIIGYVFDAARPGSGKPFDWSLIKSLPTDNRLVILAGGLNPDNVAEAIEYLHPDVVDVSSGVENDNGIGKAPDKSRRFVEAVRKSSPEHK